MHVNLLRTCLRLWLWVVLACGGAAHAQADRLSSLCNPRPGPSSGPALYLGQPLPDQVVLRTARTSYNTRYQVVLADDGQVYIKPRSRVPTAWAPFVHGVAADGVQALSLDDQALVLVDCKQRLLSLGRDLFTLGASGLLNTLYNSGEVVKEAPAALAELLQAFKLGQPEHARALVQNFANWAGLVLEVAGGIERRGMNQYGLHGAASPLQSSLLKPTLNWGSPLGMGPGMTLPPGTQALALSVVSMAEDGYYRDAAGGVQNIGGANCTSLFVLNDNGRRITLMDPWLPTDHSYEVGLPNRGQFVAQGLSASGSSLFIIGPDGSMWTRRYDFDMSGSDRTFFPAAFKEATPPPLGSMKSTMDTVVFGQSQRIAGPTWRVVLGTDEEPWTAQPRIGLQGARLWDAISIEKAVEADPTTGDTVRVLPGVDQRVLRVPAIVNEGGRELTGYFERLVSMNCGKARGHCGPQSSWRFVPHAFAGGVPPGKPLGAPDAFAGRSPAPVEASFITGNASWSVTLDRFLLHASPARLTLNVGGAVFPMRLFHFDGMRQAYLDPIKRHVVDDAFRGPGGGRALDDLQPRVMYGALELTPALMDAVVHDPLGKVAQFMLPLVAPLVAASGGCGSGRDTELGLCYPSCRPGFQGLGPNCFTHCPAGWRDNGVGGCEKPVRRRPGYALWDQKKCEAEHRRRCEQGMVTAVPLLFPKPDPGYKCVPGVATDCYPECPAAFKDIGLLCLKASYGRGAPQLPLSPYLPVRLVMRASTAQVQVLLAEIPSSAQNLDIPAISWQLNRR